MKKMILNWMSLVLTSVFAMQSVAVAQVRATNATEIKLQLAEMKRTKADLNEDVARVALRLRAIEDISDPGLVSILKENQAAIFGGTALAGLASAIYGSAKKKSVYFNAGALATYAAIFGSGITSIVANRLEMEKRSLSDQSSSDLINLHREATVKMVQLDASIKSTEASIKALENQLENLQ